MAFLMLSATQYLVTESIRQVSWHLEWLTCWLLCDVSWNQPYIQYQSTSSISKENSPSTQHTNKCYRKNAKSFNVFDKLSVDFDRWSELVFFVSYALSYACHFSNQSTQMLRWNYNFVGIKLSLSRLIFRFRVNFARGEFFQCQLKPKVIFLFWLISQSSKFLMCFVMQNSSTIIPYASWIENDRKNRKNTNIWLRKSPIKFYCPWFWTNQNITTTSKNIIKLALGKNRAICCHT